ncbi:unnamed protein product [Dovyalis caffra]|uniref:Uncharacterized protein n=1 Tax=Dovyalis caffra TaxID=77055 RepID=A0AAV1SE50_9ROSI|nr:unnamed protein product [Dovyalis caffra]
MAGKPIAGEGLPANLAGMTKNQLYDIMSQMKALIEQNKQQAKDILIQNPSLTKALFQAQIMLGMVQPPQVIPNIQPAAPQQPQQSAQPSQQPNIQAAHLSPGQGGLQDQTSASQSQPPLRKQHQSQPAMPTSAPSGPPVNLQSPPLPSHPLQMPQQPKGHMNPQVTPMSVTQSSQLPNLPPAPSHSVSQPLPIHQTQMSSVSSQLQQPLQTAGISHLPLQPPLAPQPRPPVPSFHHQYGQQMGPNMGYQHTGAPHHPSQPMFHSSNKPQTSMGPSFPQVQQPLPNQQPHQSYQVGTELLWIGFVRKTKSCLVLEVKLEIVRVAVINFVISNHAGGSHLGAEYNSQVANSMQVDRGSLWMSGPPEGSTMTHPGPPQFNPGQMAQGNHPSRTAAMSSDMEKALLQQVMSLTPEQIGLLPPEQRNQVLQLQQMLRQVRRQKLQQHFWSSQFIGDDWLRANNYTEVDTGYTLETNLKQNFELFCFSATILLTNEVTDEFSRQIAQQEPQETDEMASDELQQNVGKPKQTIHLIDSIALIVSGKAGSQSSFNVQRNHPLQMHLTLSWNLLEEIRKTW